MFHFKTGELQNISRDARAGVPFCVDIMSKAPPILPFAQWWFDTFLLLESDRPSTGGMGEAPIPISAIISYGRDYLGYCDEELDEFLYIIHAVDLIKMNAQQDQKARDKKPS